jgi:hypothetical protein
MPRLGGQIATAVDRGSDLPPPPPTRHATLVVAIMLKINGDFARIIRP